MTPSNAASSSSGHASDYDDTNKEDCISCFTGKETVKASNVDSPTVNAAAPWVACMNRLLTRSLLCMDVTLTSHVPFVSIIVYSSVRHGYQHRSASGSVRCCVAAFACQSSIVTNNSRKHKWLTLYLFYLDFLVAIETAATCMHTLGGDDRAHLLYLLGWMNTADSDATRLELLNFVDGFIRRSTTENQNDTVAAFHTIMGMQNDQISNFIARMEAEFAANATRRDQAQAGGVVTNTTTGPDVLQGIVVHTPRRDHSVHSPTGVISAMESAESVDISSVTDSFNTNTGNTASKTIGATLSNEQAQLGNLGEEKVEEAAEDAFSLDGVIEETAPSENEAGGVSSVTVTVVAPVDDVVELNEETQNETGDISVIAAAVPPTVHVENDAGEGGTTVAATTMEHTENNMGEDVACQEKCCVIL